MSSEDDEQYDDSDVHKEENVESELEDDEISAEEEGFMKGYEEAGERKRHDQTSARSGRCLSQVRV